MYINSINTNVTSFKQTPNVTKKTANTSTNESFIQENKKVLGYSAGALILGVLTFVVTKHIKSIKHQKVVKQIRDNINAEFNKVDKTKGLNNIKGQDEVVNKVKEDVLKPFLMEKLGMDLSSTNSLPNGMVINSKNPETGKNIVDALIEHAEGLGFRTIKIDNSQAKHQNDFSKNIRDTLKEVQEHFAKTKEYTFVDIGCLDNYAHSRRTNVEYLDSVNALLKPFENSSKKGAFWTGWSKDTSLLDDALLDRGYEFKAL